ncbi:MAG: hypothetical protein JW941_10845, partial [Candidatus Coatesbacteria bacterium]|nr:hypothetical protein [Candidatus Coatesbacteria bacterium]
MSDCRTRQMEIAPRDLDLFFDDRILDSLFLLLAEVDAGGLQVLKKGGIAKSAINRLQAVIDAQAVKPSEFPRLKQDRLVRFLMDLLLEMGLLETREQESTVVVSDSCSKWLDASLDVQLNRLYSSYLQSSWDELYQIPNLRIDVSGR